MPASPRVAILEKHGRMLSWHRDLESGFRANGAEVAFIQLRPCCWAEYREKLRTGLPALENPAILARVAAELRAARPDLVILLKHPGLPASALNAWRSVVPAAPFVAWICDHLPSWPQAIVPGFDGIYYFDSATQPLLSSTFAGSNTRLIHLPLAVSLSRYSAPPVPFSQRRPLLVFAGKNTADRKRNVEAFRAAGGRIDTYGPLADVGYRVWRRRHLDASQLSRLYSEYFGVLNLLQVPNTVHGLNLRAFEVPAAGGLSTYPAVPDLASVFVPGEEIVAYRDLADLKLQIDLLLADRARASAIATAGHARVLREHTFTHRARRILDDWLASG